MSFVSLCAAGLGSKLNQVSGVARADFVGEQEKRLPWSATPQSLFTPSQRKSAASVTFNRGGLRPMFPVDLSTSGEGEKTSHANVRESEESEQ